MSVIDVGASMPSSSTPSASPSGAGSVVTWSAVVMSVADAGADSSAATVISLEVPVADAGRVASLAAAGRIALVEVAPGG